MSGVDRALAGFGFRLHNVLARRLGAGAALAAEVERHALRWHAAPLEPAVSDLRYRLRRDGLRRALIAESFGLYAARLPSSPAPAVLAGALALARGGIVELAGAAERRGAIALVALVHALHGERVHLLCATEASAKALHELVAAPFSALGLTVGCVLRAAPAAARREAYAAAVVCATHREVAQDYLRDRMLAGEGRGRLSGQLERLTSRGERPMVGELGWALVEDADLLLLDDAPAPVTIAAEADQSRERLLYEQALELARGLQPGTDFTPAADGIVLTEAAARVLERLVAPLGGAWASRQHRETLVALALEALHVLRRDIDYRVQGGQVLFPPRPPQEEAQPPAPEDEEIRKLVEIKEGCPLSARREVLARMSMPRFFGRYRGLAGVCADARFMEPEFWSLYGLKTSLAGARPVARLAEFRVFRTAEDKHAALIQAVQAAAEGGRAAAVAVRRPAEAQALQAAGVERIVMFTAAQPAGACDVLLAAELPDAARHLERLQRESGAASCAVLLSLDEEPVAAGLGATMTGVAKLAIGGKTELAPPLAAWLGRRAQRAAERTGRSLRLEIKARDQALDDLLAFSGQRN